MQRLAFFYEIRQISSALLPLTHILSNGLADLDRQKISNFKVLTIGLIDFGSS